MYASITATLALAYCCVAGVSRELHCSLHVPRSSSQVQTSWLAPLACSLCSLLEFSSEKRVESVDHVLPERFFTPVTTFLLFNLMALIGNLLTTNGLPIPGPKRLWIPVCLRFLLLPAMLFCNYRPSTRVLPVLIRSDWLYSLLSALQGLSNGYLLSLAVMYAPKMVSKQDSPTVGMMIGVTGQSDEESLLFTMKRGSAVRHGFHRLGVTTTFLWPLIVG